MKYKIQWIQQGKTSTGKVKADAEVVGEDGTNTELTIWGDFPGFQDLMPGSEVEGEIKPASDPKYKPSLNAPKSPVAQRSGAYKGKVIEEAQNRKAEQIRGFQAEKGESIRLAGAQRDAVLIVATFYKDGEWDESFLKEKIVNWRDWFLSKEFNETLPF